LSTSMRMLTSLKWGKMTCLSEQDPCLWLTQSRHVLKPPWDGLHDDMGCMTLNVELVLTFDKISYHKTNKCAKMDKGL
jgi:hypothetical protein